MWLESCGEDAGTGSHPMRVDMLQCGTVGVKWMSTACRSVSTTHPSGDMTLRSSSVCGCCDTPFTTKVDWSATNLAELVRPVLSRCCVDALWSAAPLAAKRVIEATRLRIQDATQQLEYLDAIDWVHGVLVVFIVAGLARKIRPASARRPSGAAARRAWAHPPARRVANTGRCGAKQGARPGAAWRAAIAVLARTVCAGWGSR